MILIVGLGNPGKKYEKTRHNSGFMMADKLRKEWNFPDFKFNKKFNAEISQSNLKPLLPPGEGARRADEGKIILAKPQIFMNLSGQAVKKIMKFYKLKPSDIIIIHDDLDIKLGKFKISEDSRSAGHNGVQSIIDNLGTQKFTRIRIGIGGLSRLAEVKNQDETDAAKRKTRKIAGDLPRPDSPQRGKTGAFVLKNFTPAENKTIQKISGEIISSIQKISQR